MQIRSSQAIARWAPWLWLAGAAAPTVAIVLEEFFLDETLPCRSPFPAWINLLTTGLVLACMLAGMLASLVRPGLLPGRIGRALLLPIAAFVLAESWVWFTLAVPGFTVCFQD